MTRMEQIQFIKELCTSIQADVIQTITKGKIPEEWDGHELRELLAYKFQHATMKMPLQRRRDFNNTVVVNNL